MTLRVAVSPIGKFILFENKLIELKIGAGVEVVVSTELGMATRPDSSGFPEQLAKIKINVIKKNNLKILTSFFKSFKILLSLF